MVTHCEQMDPEAPIKFICFSVKEVTKLCTFKSSSAILAFWLFFGFFIIINIIFYLLFLWVFGFPYLFLLTKLICCFSIHKQFLTIGFIFNQRLRFVFCKWPKKDSSFFLKDCFYNRHS